MSGGKSGPDENTQTDFIDCPNCGKRVQAQAPACPSCGRKMDVEVPGDMERVRHSRTPTDLPPAKRSSYGPGSSDR